MDLKHSFIKGLHCIIFHFSPCYEGEEDFTNTHFMELKVTDVLKLHQVLLVPPIVFFEPWNLIKEL